MLKRAFVKHPDLKVYLSITLGLLILFYFAYAINPAGRDALLAEDSVVENLTAFLYFEAFFIGLWYWHSRKAGLFLPVLSLLGGLEELSYGERIFGYQISDVTGVNTEVLHNIPEMVPYHVKFFATAFIIACIALFLLIYLKWLPLHKMMDFGRNLLANPYFCFFLFFIITAETVDLFGKVPVLPLLIEETFEMAASVSLLFAVRQAVNVRVREDSACK
jgi:hypothetical protein